MIYPVDSAIQRLNNWSQIILDLRTCLGRGKRFQVVKYIGFMGHVHKYKKHAHTEKNLCKSCTLQLYVWVCFGAYFCPSGETRLQTKPDPTTCSLCLSRDQRSSYFWGALIEYFHARDQWACFSTKTKENVSIRIEFNFRRISWGNQHGRCSFV